jgi:hypothetical protein
VQDKSQAKQVRTGKAEGEGEKKQDGVSIGSDHGAVLAVFAPTNSGVRISNYRDIFCSR